MADKIRLREGQMIVITHENVQYLDWDKWLEEFARRWREKRKWMKEHVEQVDRLGAKAR